MWGFFNGRNGDAKHQSRSHLLLHVGGLSRVHRQRLALNAASHWLADALEGSPHAVYMRTDAAFEPAVVRGIEEAPSFAVEDSLPRELRRTCGPVMTIRSHRARLFDAALDPVDRALLRRTGAIALVPLSPDRDLEAFLLVGGPLAAFDPERLARALVPVSACLRIARNGAPGPGSEPEPEPPLPVARGVPSLAFSGQ
jgi:hypothetical protein